MPAKHFDDSVYNISNIISYLSILMALSTIVWSFIICLSILMTLSTVFCTLRKKKRVHWERKSYLIKEQGLYFKNYGL